MKFFWRSCAGGNQEKRKEIPVKVCIKEVKGNKEFRVYFKFGCLGSFQLWTFFPGKGSAGESNTFPGWFPGRGKQE